MNLEHALQLLEKCRDAQRLGNFELSSASISSTVGYAYLLSSRPDEAVVRGAEGGAIFCEHYRGH